jgi:antirestriction protein ArdC
VLKNDKRAIFSAASHAQKAVDFLHGQTASSKAEAACAA